MLRRIVELVVVSGLLFAGLAGPGFVPAASEARADAGNAAVVEKVGASLVFIRTRFMGQVGVTDPDRATAWSSTVIVTGQCTGYVVDQRGFIATAGHCVNGTDSEILNALRLKVITDVAARAGKSTDWARQLYRQSVAESWPVRGDATTSEPIVEVSVRQPVGDSQVLSSWTNADVVSHQEFKAGDNAVLKTSPVREIPALVVSGKTPTPGDAVISVGFPGAVQSTAGDGRVPQPSYKTGTVSSRQVDDSGITRTEVSATMGSGMSGGPTVNSEGEVIGTNSSGTSLPDENASFNFITDNLALRDYLSSNNVVLAQPETREQRSVWIWLGPVLGALALVIVIALVALWLRRLRRRKAPVVPGMPIGAPPVQPQNPYGAVGT
ncbi:MAG: trypsin-like peptidase domain-containing protein, partial [Gordonia amarae]